MGVPNQFRQTPGRALLAFAITAGLVAIFTFVDARRRPQLEGYDFPTALGDREKFDFPADYDPSKPVKDYVGKTNFRRRAKELVRYDKYMFKVGRDDGDNCYLYRYAKPRSGISDPEGIFYAKVGDGSYIELGFSPRSAGDAGDESGPTS